MKPYRLLIFLVTSIILISSYVIFTQYSKRDYYIKTVAGDKKIGESLEVYFSYDQILSPIIPTSVTVTSEGTKRNFQFWKMKERVSYETYKSLIQSEPTYSYLKYFINDEYAGVIDHQLDNAEYEDYYPTGITIEIVSKNNEKDTIQLEYPKKGGFTEGFVRLPSIEGDTITFITEDMKTSTFQGGNYERQYTEEVLLRAYSYNIKTKQLQLLDEELLKSDKKDTISIDSLYIKKLKTAQSNIFIYKEDFLFGDSGEEGTDSVDARENYYVLFNGEKFTVNKAKAKVENTTYFVHENNLYTVFNDEFKITKTDLDTFTEESIQLEKHSYSYIDYNTDIVLKDNTLVVQTVSDSTKLYDTTTFNAYDIQTGELVYEGEVVYEKKGKEHPLELLDYGGLTLRTKN